MSSIIKVDTVQDTDGNNIINENANTITIGKSGDTVTVASGATLLGGGIQWQSSIVTGATHTASANQGLWLDTSSNAITLTLPASPSVGDQLIFTDYARNWDTNAVTLNLNSEKFQGNTTPLPVYDTKGESVDIVYSGTAKGWIPNNDGAVALETPQTYSADLLVVAGGGGSGSAKAGSGSGAGGAGGYRTASSITLTPGQVYTVTVGDGGAGGTGTSGNVDGSNGSPSSISGSGITTVTSAGGGGGGDASGGNGLDGGSGGGGGGNSGATGATGGSGNVPSVSPSQGNDGGNVTSGSGYGAGGGGAGGAAPNGGGNPSSGGPGTANSITGSSVTYAAGGIAGSGSPGAVGAANTGNGGSGSGQAYAGSAGGSGIVILSVPDGNYSGTTTGSPTVTTGVSGKTIIQFTGDGSYTA